MDNGRDVRKKTFSIAIQSAGAERLRKTIQAKLADFMGSHTDDVLAEYVVVLVGHGKQFSQTSEDLEAFLGENTEPFVDWLWAHLTANKHLYISKSSEEPQQEAPKSPDFAPEADDERQQKPQRLTAENVEGRAQPSAIPKEEVEREWGRQDSDRRIRSEDITHSRGIRGAIDVSNEEHGHKEQAMEHRLTEDDSHGRYIRSQPDLRHKRTSDRRGEERVGRAERFQSGERYQGNRQDPETSRIWESSEGRRNDDVEDYGRQSKVFEKKPSIENVHTEEEEGSRSRRNQWPDHLYRPPALGDGIRREGMRAVDRGEGRGDGKGEGRGEGRGEVRGEGRGEGRGTIRRTEGPGGAQTTKNRGKIVSNVRHPHGTQTGEEQVEEGEKMEVEEPPPLLNQDAMEESGQEKPQLDFDGRSDFQARRWGGLDRLDKGNRPMRVKRGRPGEAMNSRIERDVRQDDTTMKVETQPIVRMNPSARLLQSAVRDAVGPSSVGPAVKRLRPLITPVPEAPTEEEMPLRSIEPSEEINNSGGVSSVKVWGRLSETSAPIKANGKGIVKVNEIDSSSREPRGVVENLQVQQPQKVVTVKKIGNESNKMDIVSQVVRRPTRLVGRLGLVDREINDSNVEPQGMEKGLRLMGRLGQVAHANRVIETEPQLMGRETRSMGRFSHVGHERSDVDVEPQVTERQSRLVGRLGQVDRGSDNVEAEQQAVHRRLRLMARLGPVDHVSESIEVEPQGLSIQKRLMGRLGLVNGYPDNVPRQVGVMTSLPDFRNFHELTTGRGEFLERSTMQPDLRYGAQYDDMEGWNGSSFMKHGHTVDTQMGEKGDEGQHFGRLRAKEVEEGFLVQAPPLANLKGRLGLQSGVNEIDSQSDFASRVPEPVSAGFSGLPKFDRGGGGGGFSSWHRVQPEQRAPLENHGTSGASLRAVMEETETDDEAMEDQGGVQPAAASPSGVEELKRRMQQVKQEMLKLKARQEEVATLKRSSLMAGGTTSGTPPTKEEIDARSIFVNNVHFAATVPGITAHFSSCGKVLRATLLTDPSTGLPKGCAYVEFESKDAVEKALAINDTSYLSRMLKVVRKPAEPTISVPPPVWGTLRRGGAGRASVWATSPHSFSPSSAGRGIPPPVTSLQWKRNDITAVETPLVGEGNVASNPVTGNGTVTVVSPGVTGASNRSPVPKSNSFPGRTIGRSLSYHRVHGVPTGIPTGTPSSVSSSVSMSVIGQVPNNGTVTEEKAVEPSVIESGNAKVHEGGV